MDKHNHGGENNNGRGDWIHVVIGHMEHLMDLFEVALAFIVAFGFILSVIPLLKQIPHLASYTTGTEEFHEFLENTLTLVIGIEFIKMLIKHTPGSVIEVLLFAIARHAILTGGTALENLLTILAIAVIFAIRKFIFIESFEFAGDGSGIDWLNDWKEIVKQGRPRVKVRKADSSKKAERVEAPKKSEAPQKPEVTQYTEVSQ